MYRIGVDLGGTNIATGVIDENYKIIGRGKVKTRAPRPAEEIFDSIKEAVDMAVKEAGISYDEKLPGFKHIILKPQPNRLIPEVKASYNSIYGPIVSNMRYEGATWKYVATIPANTSATIYLPVTQLDALAVPTASGLHFAGFDSKNGFAVFEAVAGTYNFKCVL